ncbi:SGNH/GDSL hydrolase family protein [Frigoribacterium sp. UYMn621]|uniref:SGNH/GDSL hydrolase family protein n=1 Tax=Frigoribacterium sp. UYMn621 TaxID=3156343 RepID=UPI003395C85C
MSRITLLVAGLCAAVLLVGALVAIAAGTGQRGTDRSESTGTGTRVSFYGDSYTLGTGASDPAKRWSTVISKARNWNEFNPSVNGLGFVNNRSSAIDEPGEVIASKPEIVFITMGLNDNFSYDVAADRIKAQITTDFQRLKAALPDARFIVVEPFWYTDARPASLAVISGWVKDAAAAIHADYIPGASHWIEHHPEWMASDGLHPNDTGYAQMAKRMESELHSLGL